MQVFRLMGLPDKVIAFDELPEDMVKGFELCRAEGFPKYWKNWMGTKKMITKIPTELNPVTGERRTFDPIVDEDSYFYLVDWSLKPAVEKWRQIESYVRSHVPSEFRLTDKLEDMAKPLAANKTEGISLEPDDVVVIPIPKDTSLILEKKQKVADVFKCVEPGCDREFDAKQGLVMHKMKKHPKKEEVPVPASL